MPETKTSVGIKLTAAMHKGGKARAAAEMRSFSGYIEWLIAKDIEANPLRPPKTKRKGQTT